MKFKKFYYKRVSSTNDLAIKKIKAGEELTAKYTMYDDFNKDGD